jgi:hypothetical protein
MAIPKKYAEKYIDFDEIEDVLASVELVALLAPRVGDQPSFWKWIVIGAHSALRGAMVCAIADSTGTSVLTKKSAMGVLDFFYAEDGERGDYPGKRLAQFDELLERCQQGSPTCEPLVLTPNQRRDIKKLSVFRNKFAHFTPESWFIEKAGLPRIIGSALTATEELMKRPEVCYRYDEPKRERLTAALSTARCSLGLPGGADRLPY